MPPSARLLAINADSLNTFIGALNFIGSKTLDSERAAEKWPRQVPLDRLFSRTPVVKKILAELEREERMFFGSGHLAMVSGEAAARYLAGGWLEEYTFACSCAAGGDEVSWSQVVSWDMSAEKPVSNEFDCLIMRSNRLYLLECKTRNFSSGSSEVVYKLDSLKDAIAGVYGLGALVSARPLPEHLRSRADARKHQVFGPAELREFTAVLKEWLNDRG